MSDQDAKKSVLLKIPGVHKAMLGPLMDFINSTENCPKEAQDRTKVCHRYQYVTLLKADITDGEQAAASPTYQVSLKIMTTFGNGHDAYIGTNNGPTPKRVMHRVFEILAIFPSAKQID